MTRTMDMLRTSPTAPSFDVDALSRCIDECLACVQACSSCADSCLGEERIGELRRCIRLNLDCADVCSMTASDLSRQLEPELGLIRSVLQACAEACRVCGGEYERHASMHEHCRVCAEACRSCEDACRRLLEAVTATAAWPQLRTLVLLRQTSKETGCMHTPRLS